MNYTEKTERKSLPRSRTFFITQAERHPTTGEVLLTEEQIKESIEKRDSIKHWAYIRHDERDTKEDGSPVNPHWHIAISTPLSPYTVNEVAKWFGVDPQYVEVGRSRGAFFNMCQYLTHRDEKSKAQEKFPYPLSEVCANFDYPSAIEEGRYRPLTDKERLRLAVMNGEITIREIKQKNNSLKRDYLNDYRTLEYARHQYLASQPMPSLRLCYYIGGEGRIGKSTISRAWARLLAEGVNPALKESVYDDDKFFQVGDEGTSLMGYDGQPVVIFDDTRANELLRLAGSRGELFKLLDPHPERQTKHVKYASVYVTSPYIIINSTQTYEQFLDGLAGAFYTMDGEKHYQEDPKQTYGRFPIVMDLNREKFRYLINKGWAGYEGVDAFKNFVCYKEVQSKMKIMINGKSVNLLDAITDDPGIRNEYLRPLSSGTQIVVQENPVHQFAKEDEVTKEMTKNYIRSEVGEVPWTAEDLRDQLELPFEDRGDA